MYRNTSVFNKYVGLNLTTKLYVVTPVVSHKNMFGLNNETYQKDTSVPFIRSTERCSLLMVSTRHEDS